jgi:DNA-binding MarR family transcriptional regulator
MEHVPLMRLLSMVVSAGLDELHEELAAHGHDRLRPVHGYALNAILNGSRTASEIAPRLGMTKQGAAKLVQHLLEHGYVEEGGDQDGRRKPLILTDRGEGAIALSVAIQQAIEDRWSAIAGTDSMSTARRALESVVLEHAEPDGRLPPVRPTR